MASGRKDVGGRPARLRLDNTTKRSLRYVPGQGVLSFFHVALAFMPALLLQNTP